MAPHEIQPGAKASASRPRTLPGQLRRRPSDHIRLVLESEAESKWKTASLPSRAHDDSKSVMVDAPFDRCALINDMHVETHSKQLFSHVVLTLP
jgi:hypothetical protein